MNNSTFKKFNIFISLTDLAFILIILNPLHSSNDGGNNNQYYAKSNNNKNNVLINIRLYTNKIEIYRDETLIKDEPLELDKPTDFESLLVLDFQENLDKTFILNVSEKVPYWLGFQLLKIFEKKKYTDSITIKKL